MVLHRLSTALWKTASNALSGTQKPSTLARCSRPWYSLYDIDIDHIIVPSTLQNIEVSCRMSKLASVFACTSAVRRGSGGQSFLSTRCMRRCPSCGTGLTKARESRGAIGNGWGSRGRWGSDIGRSEGWEKVTKLRREDRIRAPCSDWRLV